MVDLDLPSTPPPPLTSFTGFRSRIMASFMSFLTRRQADRTTSMFGICFFMLKPPPQLFRSNVLATSSRREQAEKLFDRVRKAARITNCPLPCPLFVRGLFADASGQNARLSVSETKPKEAPRLSKSDVIEMAGKSSKRLASSYLLGPTCSRS